jgi:hypothetical protein
MRRLFVPLVLVAATVLPAGGAAAALGTAADFAADCNDDGLVIVSGTQRYIGGNGAITGGCNVVMSRGTTLVLRDVVLTGTAQLSAISSPRNTTIRVLESTIEVAGALEFTAGCCGGGEVLENDGTVIVRDSTLLGDSVQLLASFDHPDGKVVVARSTLAATGALGIQVRASDLGGRRGIVKIIDTEANSDGDLLVRTGTRGLTVARRNQFSAAGSVTITTGTGGVCRSSGNTPPTPCV